MIGGRHTHPIAHGGWAASPTCPQPEELLALRQRLVDARMDMDETVALSKTAAVARL